MTVATLTAATDTGNNTGVLVLILVGLALWLGLHVVGRRARTCARHGHVPDPDTIGSWNERCMRCGGRIS